MTRTRWIMLAVLALIGEAIAVRIGLCVDLIPKLSGPAAWTTSRAAGVIAFAALTLDVVFGMFVSTGLVDRWVPRGASVDVHKWLSSVSLTLVGLHVLALLGDGDFRFDALDAVVPWLSPYKPGAVALGVFATYGAVLVHASSGWRKWLGIRVWRALHFTAFAVFVAATLHGLLAGRSLHALYVGALLLVGALVVVRVALAFKLRIPNAA